MMASAASSMAGAMGLSDGKKNEKEIAKLNSEIAKLQLDDNYNQTKIRRLKNNLLRSLLNTSDIVRGLANDFESKYDLMKKQADTLKYDAMDKGDPLNLEAELGIGGKEDDYHEII